MHNYKISKFIIFFSLVVFTNGCSKIETPDVPAKTADGTGLKTNTPTSLEKIPEADFSDDIFITPASFSLDVPTIITQQETSKCAAFSSAYYIIGLYNGLGSASPDNDKAGSPEFAYAYYKKINNDDCASGSFMFDEGNATGMAEILKTVGTTSWNQLPFVNSNVCTITTAAQVTQAANNKISDYARLDEDQFSNVAELKNWIYSGYPLWFGVDIDGGFQELGTGTWSKPSGKSEGGHAMTLVGWDDSKKAFKIVNSWGKDWGDNGFGWVDYTYFTTLLKNGGSIGALFPNDRQKAIFNKLTPSSCGNASWGELVIENKLSNEVAIELVGKNYLNKKTSIDANDKESYYGVSKGDVKVRVFDSNRVTLLKEYNVTIVQCSSVIVIIN
jgi:Papain family cysteine protease